ncbi:MAG: aldose 1-epimerase family protein [Chloroflexota bacterium]
MIDPSGEQFEIVLGDQRATIVQVGGGLRSFQAGDLEVLDGYPSETMCHDGRGQLLAPWPNRLAGGEYQFEGESHRLPINEPASGNAIHGLVRWANWIAGERTPSSIVMSYCLYPSPGYPFTLQLSARYALQPEGLEVQLAARNAGTRTCPFGAGQHPYIKAGPGAIDSARLQIPAGAMYRYNQKLIPTERVPVGGSHLDFRTPKRIADTVINTDFTDLTRDEKGYAGVALESDEGPRVTVWMDGSFPHVTVYTGETVLPESRRRHGLAVEPMSCPPNAFQSGEDLVVLQSGQTWRGSWGVSVAR